MERSFKEKIMEVRKKKSIFIRQNAHKKKRLGTKWRRPRGLQSKMRLGKAGRRKKVSAGYRSPKSMRNLHVSGLKNVLVYNEGDVKKIDSKEEVMTIAKVGLRNKIAIVKEAMKKSIKILNLNEPGTFLENTEKILSVRKEKKKKKVEAKEKKKEVKVKKKESEELEEKVDDKETAKKEKDKVLTKKV